jgi:hypothetical protein
MNTQNAILFLFIAVFLAFTAWSVVRGRRWEKHQGEAANRAKAIIEATSQDRERFSEVMSISREQLQVTKELLSEIKGLRNDLKKNVNPSA